MIVSLPYNDEVPLLVERCAEATRRYLRRQPCEPHFCYALFRRAVETGATVVWESLLQIYAPLLEHWVYRHPRYPQTYETPEFFVNGAWARFAQYMTPDKFYRSRDLAAVLAYLKLCVHSEIEGYVALLAPAEASIDEHDIAAPTAAPLVEASQFWGMVTARLKNAKEACVMDGLYREGLTPRDLYARAADDFRDVREIYRIAENVLARLRRDRELERWIADYLA
jgi:hypothetical protein